MTDDFKNKNELIEDKTQALSIQDIEVKGKNTQASQNPSRIRRQNGSCPFLCLLPKMGETTFLAAYEADLQRKLEQLSESRDDLLSDQADARNSEIAMLKQSLDWLKLKGV